MKADNAKALGLLLLGFLFILSFASFTFEESQVVTPSMPSLLPPPYTEKLLLNVEPPEAAGVFHPLTEEYLRQQAKEVPYKVSETLLEPKVIKVFEPFSPLELALLPEEKPVPRRRKIRRLPVGERGRGDEWRPLSEEEWKEQERELARKAVEMGVELTDSLYIPYFSKSILWTTQRFNAYQHHLAEQYRLHLDLSEEDATLTYNVKY